MPATTPAEEPRERAADPQRAKHRYRTVIPAPSGNYAFIKTIGQGSMGKVKLAKREGTNELASLASHGLPYSLSV
jgi:serine/threonine protein kinase KIN1/2